MSAPTVTPPRPRARAWGDVPRRRPRRTPPGARPPARTGARARRVAGLAGLAALALAGSGLGLLLAGAGLVAGPLAPLLLVLAPVLVVLAWRRSDLVVPTVALTLPLGHLGAGPVDLVQLVTALGAVAVLAPAAARLDWRLPPWPVAVPLGLFLVVAALATPRARDADLAFRLDVQLLLLVLLVVAVLTGVRTTAQLTRVVVGLLVAGAASSVWALVASGPTESFYGGGVVTGRAVGVFSQPNELGLFSAVLLVLALGVGLGSASPRLRATGLVAAGLLVAALGASLSRGAWFGALAGVVALAVLVAPTRRSLLRLGAGLVVVVGALGLLGVGPLGQVLDRVASVGEAGANPYDQRPLIWAEGLRLVAEAPLLGHGPGGYFLEAASDSLRSGVVLEVEHAHHLLLNTAVEFGLVGLGALLVLVAGLGAGLLRARRVTATLPPAAEVRLLPGVLAAALVPVLAHGMLDYPLRNPVVLTTVWLVLAALVAACEHARATAPTPTQETR